METVQQFCSVVLYSSQCNDDEDDDGGVLFNLFTYKHTF